VLDAAVLEKWLRAHRRFEQLPPSFSAEKGAWAPRVRTGAQEQPVELKPVEVELYEYKLLEIEAASRVSSSSAHREPIFFAGARMGQKLDAARTC